MPAQAIHAFLPEHEPTRKQISEAALAILSNGGNLAQDQLALVATPPGTETHRPIPHAEIVGALVETLGFRHIGMIRDEYAVSQDGMKMFGVLDLDAGMLAADICDPALNPL